MEKFKATYMPKVLVDGDWIGGEPETVMVLGIDTTEDCYYVIFVDSKGKLNSDFFNRFSDCDVWEENKKEGN